MKERPILFSAPMIRAILEGRKTMTRRIVNPDLASELEDGRTSDSQRIETDETPMGGLPAVRFCPYGGPGDRLWVRETWATWPSMDKTKPSKVYCQPVHYKATFDPAQVKHAPAVPKKWRPSIFMPRWASRITLDVTAVRVERLQEITDADCIAEGYDHFAGWGARQEWYRKLWDGLNAKRGLGWDVNPWVWVVTFQRAKQESAP